MNQKLLITLLRDFFEIEDPAFLETVSGQLTLVELPAGAALFRQGEVGTDVYFLIHGRLRNLVSGPDGQLTPEGDIVPGDTIGELAFLSDAPRDSTVVALRSSSLIRMSCAQFEQTLKERPEVAISVMRNMVARSRKAQTSRQAPVPPQTICIIPITDRVDALDFAQQFHRSRQAMGDNVALLSEHDPVGTRSAIASMEEEPPQVHSSFIMVAERDLTDWSRTCIGLADEIILLADASCPPDLAHIEAALPESQEFSSVDRTLVLLHQPETRSPSGTAAWINKRDLKRHIHVRRGHAGDMRRVTRLLTGRGVGVVLSGGGARGLAHIGVLDALAEAGIEIDIVGGTSIGSVIGTLHAMEVRGTAMRDAARRAFVAGGNPVGDYNLLPFVSISRGQRVRGLTEVAVSQAIGPDGGIEDCWTNLFLVAADYSASAEAVLLRGPLIKSLLASYAIPGVLPPIAIDSHLYIDGGTVNNLPIDVMARQGAGKIIAVDVLSETVHTYDFDWVPSQKTLLLYRLGRMFGRRPKHRVPGIIEIMLKSSFINAIARQRDMRSQADLNIVPALPRIRFLDWKKLDASIEGGLSATRSQLASLDAELMASLQATK
ncbi:MAG: cyclic nucleotide-binding and patatin-like phospholipase domain-containing protein [Acidocella sp.]|nr:cyclic nucleotide-binding and patatin-like phospholipase domain-containing protein [Acidocella sp.]